MTNVEVEAMRSNTVLCKVVASALAATDVGRQTPPDVHTRIVRVQNEARLALISVSLAYEDELGWRILPATSLVKFAQVFTPVNLRFTEAFNQMFVSVAGVAQDDPTANTIDRSAILKNYQLGYMIRDHSPGEFVGVSPKHKGVLSQRFDAHLLKVVTSAKIETLERLREPLAHLVDRLSIIDQRIATANAGHHVGKAGVFRDAALTNVQVAISQLPGFNFANDPRITRVYEECQPLMEIDADGLRANKEARDLAAAAAGRISMAIEEITQGGNSV